MEPYPEVLPSLPSNSDGEAATLLALGLRVEEPPEPTWPTVQELDRLLPGYTVEGIIGRGAMGLVYRARQQRLDRAVAIKVLSPALACEPAFAERLAREATTLARLDHPGIVRIHDFDVVDGLFYLVIEHVDGPNLRALSGTGLQPLEIVNIAMQLCGALQVAHAHGIVHRDIKPENILLTGDAQVKLADFGLAKLAPWQRSTALTASHCAVGTPNYMAPEQLRSPESVDTSADIYALGVVLYEVVAGQLPIGRFPPPSAVASMPVPASLDAAIMSCLEHDPAGRPTAQALGSRLAALRTEMLAGAPKKRLGRASKTVTPTVGTPSEWAIMRDALASAPRDRPPAPASRPQRWRKRTVLPVLFGMIPVIAIVAAASEDDPVAAMPDRAWPANVQREAPPGLAALGGERDTNCDTLLSSRLDVDVGDAPVLGNPDAPVTIVVWSNYECSWCRRLYGALLPELLETHRDRIRIVHKHYFEPGHDGARRAAIFVEAAARQGQFWAAHARLLGSTDEAPWSFDRLQGLGVSMGLDPVALEHDIYDPAVAARVDADLAQAERLCVPGAPAMVVDGRFIATVQPRAFWLEAMVENSLGLVPGAPVPLEGM